MPRAREMLHSSLLQLQPSTASQAEHLCGNSAGRSSPKSSRCVSKQWLGQERGGHSGQQPLLAAIPDPGLGGSPLVHHRGFYTTR